MKEFEGDGRGRRMKSDNFNPLDMGDLHKPWHAVWSKKTEGENWVTSEAIFVCRNWLVIREEAERRRREAD
jgi:hypothetical protein